MAQSPTKDLSPNHHVSPWDDAAEPLKLSAAELRTAYQNRQLSPVEVTKLAIARCHDIQKKFNAFTHIDEDGALQAASESECRWKDGSPNSPIDGVPGTIKDIVRIKGAKVHYGTKVIAANVGTVHAPSVDRLLRAGMVMLGVTTTPEFGWKAVTDSPAFGVTKNPWNPGMTPGGSSGGAAVAAASACGNLHLGTDGGGSIRIPASFSGICGHKPTYGLVPAYPQSAFGTVAHIGPLARSIDDVEDMLQAMSGRSDRDWQQSPWLPDYGRGQDPVLAGTRIGLWSEPPVGTVHPAIADRLNTIVDRLEDEGAVVTPVSLPKFDVSRIFKVLWYAGAANRLDAIPRENRQECDPGFLEIAEAGSRYSAVDYVRAGVERADFGAAMDRLLDGVDILISPATAIPAFACGREVPPDSGFERWIDWAGFSFPINLSQQPATVIPAGMTSDRLPFGLQIVAGRGQDAHAIAFAKIIDAIIPDIADRQAAMTKDSH